MSQYVYFIEATGLNRVKIGYATNPTKRIKDLDTGSAVNLELLGVVPGSLAKERQLHQKFAQYRIKGEWFNYSDEIKDYVKENTSLELQQPKKPQTFNKANADMFKALVALRILSS